MAQSEIRLLMESGGRFRFLDEDSRVWADRVGLFNMMGPRSMRGGSFVLDWLPTILLAAGSHSLEVIVTSVFFRGGASMQARQQVW